jgi:hypothetical protein
MLEGKFKGVSMNAGRRKEDRIKVYFAGVVVLIIVILLISIYLTHNTTQQAIITWFGC